MQTGAITGYIDVAQVVLYVFWVFFAGLILYLVRENKREGYPLDNEGSRFVIASGYPDPPAPKTYLLPHGKGTVVAPNGVGDTRPVAAEPIEPFPGAPLEPTGNPMVDGVGPAAWALRKDEPEVDYEGRPNIVPMRVANEFKIAEDDPDPRGMPVVAADGEIAGTVVDLWVDRPEPQIRYLEVEVAGATASGKRRVLVPMTMARVNKSRGYVEVVSVLARHFAEAPEVKADDQVTKLEEDRICAYFGGGTLYATPDRLGPLL